MFDDAISVMKRLLKRRKSVLKFRISSVIICCLNVPFEKSLRKLQIDPLILIIHEGLFDSFIVTLNVTLSPSKLTLIPSSSLTRRIILTHISGIFSNSDCSTQMSLKIFITLFRTLMPVSWKGKCLISYM